MRKILLYGLAMVVSLTACNSGRGAESQGNLQRQSDLFAIDQIEAKWHRASSTKDIDLMMSLWAPDATFTIGSTILRGKKEIRDFFTNQAAPFQHAHHWISDTPAYKIRSTVNGDKGTLYFECHYVDVKTQKVVQVVGADQDVARINGRWLITRLIAATPKLSP
jgi:hypothetical protein